MDYAPAEAPAHNLPGDTQAASAPDADTQASNAAADAEDQTQTAVLERIASADPRAQAQAQHPTPGLEQHLPHIPHDLQQGVNPMDPTGTGVMQIDPSSLVGTPPSLSMLQHQQGSDDLGDGSGRFKPIDLESLSPKSRQRVLRNRQAATRSKAKKKQHYQLLKDRKAALAGDVEQLEAQLATAHHRVAQLHGENKTLLEACTCAKE